MNAKKCDRCKKHYDPYIGVECGERKEMINTVSVSQIVEGNVHSRFILDLCPGCAERFVKWLNGRRNVK